MSSCARVTVPTDTSATTSGGSSAPDSAAELMPVNPPSGETAGIDTALEADGIGDQL